MIKKNIYFLILSWSLFFLNGFFLLKAEGAKFIKKFELGSDKREEEIFFEITDVQADREGNIFILDSGDNCIKKFSKNKKFLIEAGEEGQGPGRMSNPLNFEIDQEGNIYVNDFGNARIDVYNNNLKYLKTIKLNKYMSIENIFINSDRNLIIFRSIRTTGQKYFNLFSPDGHFIHSFFNKLHPFAPVMKSMQEIRNYLSTFVYLIAKAGMNQDRTKIAFTHGIPENPYKIYILNNEGKVIKIIKRKIKKYNPNIQKKYFAYMIKKNNKWKNSDVTFLTIRNLHFTKEDYLIVQRRNEHYRNGSIQKVTYLLDILSPEGEVIKEEMELEGDILSIDNDNNVYVRTENEQGIPKIVVYSLKIGK